MPKFHECAADGCARVVNEKFDFCFTCFRDLSPQLQDDVTRWKARLGHARRERDGWDISFCSRRHNEALAQARAHLRGEISEFYVLPDTEKADTFNVWDAAGMRYVVTSEPKGCSSALVYRCFDKNGVETGYIQAAVHGKKREEYSRSGDVVPIEAVIAEINKGGAP
jgi:hypothetical protein